MFTWKEIIHIAVQIEQNGEETYRYAAERTEDPRLSLALSHLADEESRHARWLSRLSPKGSIPPEASEFEKITRTFLRETVADQAFSLQEVDLTATSTIEELMAIKLEFEKDTVLFYEMIRNFASDDATRTLFDTIIAEENNHINKLKNDFKTIQHTHITDRSENVRVP